MSRDNEATSDRMPSVHMGLNNDLSSPRLESTLECSSVSDRKSVSESPSEEASPSRRHLREIVLPDNWSIHDFPANMNNEIFSRLMPRFQIPDDVPIRKGDIGEK